MRKTILFVKKIILFATLSAFAAFFAGCGEKEKIDMEELVTLSYNGADGGYGYASCDYSTLEDWLEENYSEEEAVRYAIAIEDGVEFELSPKEGLSNGDEVKVTISYGDDVTDVLDDQLSPKSGSSWTVKVNGLEDPKEIDLFEGIELEYQNDGSVAVTGGYDNLIYTLSKDRGLKNGDVVTVIATCSAEGVSLEDFCIQSLGGLPASDTCEYTVEGLDEYFISPDEIPDDLMDELQGIAEDKIDEMRTSMEDSFGDQGYKLNNYGYDRCYVSTPQAETDGSTMNEVYLLYKLNASNPDGTFDYYYSVMFTNVKRNADGSYSYDENLCLPDGSYSIWSGVSGENYFCTGTEGDGFIGFQTMQDFYNYYVAPYEGEWVFTPDDF